MLVKLTWFYRIFKKLLLMLNTNRVSRFMYQSSIFGFEGSTLDNNELTPIGRMQQAGVKFVSARHAALGSVSGTMLTTVAVLLDFHAGFLYGI